MSLKPVCGHLAEVDKHHKPNATGCEECIKMGDGWVHLRVCLTCGHVGCCDSSKNKHATKHYRATDHPVVRSLERGENWGWCYVDSEFFEPLL
jgi:uncharacterized UBP type Zn finger protein